MRPRHALQLAANADACQDCLGHVSCRRGNCPFFPSFEKHGDKCYMPTTCNKNLFQACNTETLAMDIPMHRTNIGLATVTKLQVVTLVLLPKLLVTFLINK